jgi:tyrosyl-tRNA synthetase
MNDLAEDLEARGLIDHASADIGKILGEKRTVYLGVDPSSDSMQAGNLVVVLLMKRLADAGHRIVLLVGGGTGMIGDPKEKGERPLADTRIVARNKKAIKAQMQHILGRRITVVDNADWLLKVRLVDFLRDIGKHFTVNELVKRDIIKRRLENEDDSISYTEFAYSLLQGYDYMILNQNYGVDLQIGASDQWTNILSGVELVRRKLGKEAFALTCPLVTDSAGKKFGKSEGNAVWLDPAKTSPYAFYQFWLNQPDAMVGTYLKFYSFMPVMEIDLLMELHARSPGRREAQKTLARLVTEIVHGADSAARCAAVSETLFGDRELTSLSSTERATLLAEAPSLKIPPAKLAEGMPLIDVLIGGGLATSRSDARRLIEGKGITLSGNTLDSVDALITANDLSSGIALIRRGKQVLVLSTA